MYFAAPPLSAVAARRTWTVSPAPALAPVVLTVSASIAVTAGSIGLRSLSVWAELRAVVIASASCTMLLSRLMNGFILASLLPAPGGSIMITASD